MRKIISFGKIAYASQYQDNELTVELGLNGNKAYGYVFTVSGTIWNSRRSKSILCGQILDILITAPELADNDLAKEIHSLWKQYHLNDLRPYCEHQKGNPVFNKQYDEIDDDDLVCPTCGHSYGSKCIFEKIPDDILLRIKEIIRNGK